MKTTVQAVCQFLDEFAPRSLAAEWDNVGLLIGDARRKVKKVMTCLTVTPQSVAEAIAEKTDLIVTHHPLPFRPLKRLTTDTNAGRMIVDLLGAGISVYSPHTAFDSALQGINQHLAEGLKLKEVSPLVPAEVESNVGSGRYGRLASAMPLSKVAQRLKRFLKLKGLHRVGSADQMISKVAVACGSAGEFLREARRLGCDLLVTGETNFHTCLDAEASGIGMLLPGHFASERFAVEMLADVLSQEFADLVIWASQHESDPLAWV